MDDHLIRPEDYETTGELSAVCGQIVLKCLYFLQELDDWVYNRQLLP